MDELQQAMKALEKAEVMFDEGMARVGDAIKIQYRQVDALESIATNLRKLLEAYEEKNS